MFELISYILICSLNVFYAVWNSKLVDQSTKDVHDLQIAFQLLAINNELLLAIRANEKDLSDECIDKINEALYVNKNFVKITNIYQLKEKQRTMKQE